MISASFLIGCKDDTPDPPTINFVTTSLKGSEQNPTVILSAILDKPATEDITVGLKFSGIAIISKDFECGDKLIIPKGSKISQTELHIIKDQEYETEEETVIISMVSIQDALRLGDQSIATLTIPFDEAPTLVIELEWETEKGSAKGIDMNLVLWRRENEGWVVHAISADHGDKFETITLSSLLNDATFGLTYQYYDGECEWLSFKATMTCNGGKIEKDRDKIVFTGLYTKANRNPSSLVYIVQDFEKKGFNYSSFSSIYTPSKGSRKDIGRSF
ncbi:MAG TPA: hypothetical protein VIT44_17700 [Cyclobacteriaceae bacterium]